ncbi:hypothetical protein ACFWAN_32405 [Streptomyces mirabilis]|uniref:hypothetical protein n=1 Tax=Streptomyces mirabilis TaxID=68239 RepID=UPI0036504188
MSAALYRYPVFLTEADWRSAVAGFDKRVRRLRAAARLEQARRVRAAMTDADGESMPDGDEFKYVLHLTEKDYDFLRDAVEYRRNGIPRDTAERIANELLLALGDATAL